MNGRAQPVPVDEGLPSVLVVDDLQANLGLMRIVLSDLKCNVVLASSGNEALHHLLRRQFALILLDVQMPTMDGYEVARTVRMNRATAGTPIIFVTAMLDTEQDLLRGYGSGAVDYLFKPINRSILISKVSIFLELHNGRQRLERTNVELLKLATDNAALAEQFQKQNRLLDTAHRELQATQAQLVQAAKMSALGQLVAGIAHEINNPLSFALGHLHTVMRRMHDLRRWDGTPADDVEVGWGKVFERLSEMRGGLERISDLVLKLRTFSRLDEGEWKLIDVREAIESILTIFKHRTEPSVQVELQLCGDPQIECSPGLFNQAVANLVSNALDAMADTGRLMIRSSSEDGAWRLSVADTGPGIPADIRDRVLEPFFTTKPVGQGTGLGLSITYGIVRKHGGTIQVEASEAGGACFVIRLPRAGR